MDIDEVLPNFDLRNYTHLIRSLERNQITVVDLCTRDPKEIARICPLPSTDVQRLAKDVIEHLQRDVTNGLRKKRRATVAELEDGTTEDTPDGKRPKSITHKKDMISTLDPTFDKALGGGIIPGHLTELTGESATGKSTFVLNLLLSVQLPPPKGLGRAALYVSSEGPLNTKRLHQLLLHQPVYDDILPEERPSLDRVHAITVNSLEEQDQVLRYQLPIAVQRYNAGLVVVDSITMNFREHGTRPGAQLAERAAELANQGNMLRRIAIEHQVCVIVTNHVTDRIDNYQSSSPATTSSPAMSMHNLPPAVAQRRHEVQSLDHQQRFCTGWGDDKENTKHEHMKSPALGLAWANAVNARIVLKMESEQQEYVGGNIWRDKAKRRNLSVVFAPWAPPTNPPIRYEIAMQGLVAVAEPEESKEAVDEEHAYLLDEALWEDDEFP
ncbi:DNA repair protein rhp57 [Cladophialophora chaetospira]|uniref:DNA repair protein rhp57 n=1 Tax=Cladophialophora chaetospira TaxID=386627 RepID=A0AA38UDT8_9EURO|nr:DNA repair protein rhp57 [Cladophialophora chaetospira]